MNNQPKLTAMQQGPQEPSSTPRYFYGPCQWQSTQQRLPLSQPSESAVLCARSSIGRAVGSGHMATVPTMGGSSSLRAFFPYISLKVTNVEPGNRHVAGKAGLRLPTNQVASNFFRCASQNWVCPEDKILLSNVKNALVFFDSSDLLAQMGRDGHTPEQAEAMSPNPQLRTRWLAVPLHQLS